MIRRSNLEQEFPLLSTDPDPPLCRDIAEEILPKDDAQLRHESRIDRPGRVLLGATALGGAGVSVREVYALAGRAMRPCIAVALRGRSTNRRHLHLSALPSPCVP